jgi:hypothetical protein
MRNFKKILNKISFQKTQASVSGPCCEAADKLHGRHKILNDNATQYLSEDEQVEKEKQLLVTQLTGAIGHYCECTSSPAVTPKERACLRVFENFIKTGTTDKSPTLSLVQNKVRELYVSLLHMVFQNHFKEIAIFFAERDYNYDLVNNGNDIDFLNDFCEWRRIAAPSLLKDVTDEMWETTFERSIQNGIKELLLLIPTVGGAEEAQVADCEVSAENDSVKGWASALAVSAATAAAAIALYRLTRGRSAKTCAPDGKTKGVRILSGLLCGAAAGSATQNAPAQETCDAVAEQIINDECSPNPSLCEPPSGGGGSQPPGGEVEPPSGGGGGVMGGDGLL